MEQALESYFLADLPSGASLTPGLITTACQTLKRNREERLASRSTEEMLRILDEAGRSWRDPDFRFRRLALESGVGGFSRQTLESGLDDFFEQITYQNLKELIVHDLGHERRLDDLVSAPVERNSGRASIARAPDLIAHIGPSNIPNATLLNIILGILTRSAQFIKCGSEGSLIPRFFAHSLRQFDPQLSSCLELAVWQGGRHDLEEALLAEADCVTATGGDETLASLRRRLPADRRFLGYGHKVSLGYVGAAMLRPHLMEPCAERAANDVAAWDQLGCLSPQAIYVEEGGSYSPGDFAGALAKALAAMEIKRPRGALTPADSAAIAARRRFYEVRAANTDTTRTWFSERSTAWSVVFENEGSFQTSGGHRFIYVKQIAGLEDFLTVAESLKPHLSTVGVAAPREALASMVPRLARRGVTRVCPLGRMQRPPLAWRHDGRPSLGDLVEWTDWEQEEG